MAGRFLRERARQGWKLTTTEVPAGLPPHHVKGEMRWIALRLIFLWFDGHQMILPDRGGSLRLNNVGARAKWISALVAPLPGLASAG
ncbi:hypothetical protein KTN05_16900 [Paracoccus sp. Z118]|uniref:hypothetical protein n=1 Tax=Paracoccus sp. Z118 TaxID=2851017 RepID=UPI001C2C02E0|nr:hypothetical protein [Paracoccus sp. Z118]MBV0893479.1 hypothetical protein [Paracoccus sp. Z118]